MWFNISEIPSNLNLECNFFSPSHSYVWCNWKGNKGEWKIQSLVLVSDFSFILSIICKQLMGFQDGSVVKNLPVMQETRIFLFFFWDTDLSELERSTGEGNCNPLKYSCLGNPMDIGAWHATALGVTKWLATTEHLSIHECSWFNAFFFNHENISTPI